MKIKSQATIHILEGVEVSVKDRVISVKGKRGTLVKDLRHLQLDFHYMPHTRTLSATRWFGNKLDIACINTALAHIRNMCIGVTKGFRFKLRFASSHFPINVSVEGQHVEIRNFLGEKRVRHQYIHPDVKVYRTDAVKVKDELVLEGNNLEHVSHEAALMHNICAVRKKDIRKFLDGIYVQTKTHVEGEDM